MSESHQKQPSVSAIIVNYKSGAYAVECIRSLLDQKYDSLEIIVVDNASGDGSVDLLRSAFGNVIKLIESPDNLGFGQANNLAASHAKGDYLLLVNPDARLLDNAFISALVSFLEQQPAIGIAGPEIHEPSKQKYVLPKKKYPSEGRLKNRDALKWLPGPYAWILGACMCLKRSLYEQIGGFDPDFFLYGEDTDICLRVRKAGYQIGYCEAAKLTHVGGASEAAAIPLDKFLRKKRGFFLFCRKHYAAADVKRIARLSLVTTYFASLKVAIRKLLRMGNAQDLNNRLQRIDATRIVIRETIEHYRKTRA
jgi:GT2 family glycosyltransferase